jgi:hypothetical protein
MKTTKFDSWYKEFISSPQGEGAVMALEDLMGDHPEYEDLSAWVLVACFNAKRFQDSEKGSSEERRDKDKEAVQEIRGKGSNHIRRYLYHLNMRLIETCTIQRIKSSPAD